MITKPKDRVRDLASEPMAYENNALLPVHDPEIILTDECKNSRRRFIYGNAGMFG